MKVKREQLKKAMAVFFILAVLAVSYGILHAPHNGTQIKREKGGSQSYHVTWGKEEFDATISYRKQGSEKKDFLGKKREQTPEEELLAYVNEIEKKSRKEDSFSLPLSYKGKEITWEAKKDYTPYFLVVLGGILAALIYKEPDWELEKERKKRQEKLVSQYPQLVGILTTFLESGMSLRYAITRIAEEQLAGEEPLKSEVNKLSTRIKRGESLPAALQAFSGGCGIRQYRKFSSLLLQNLEKGNSGLLQMLDMEVQETEAMRLTLAKRRGEQAQTKILLPLTLLLGLVIVIIMAPAFLQIKNL